MEPTLRLYEAQPFATGCTARVLQCTPAQGGWDVVLDSTVFFPEGGGQPCDIGTLGRAAVTAVRMGEDGVIFHHTDAPLEVGREVDATIDAAHRRDLMEQHTGEHILSGILHRLYGAENVGFHIGMPAVRMDMNLPLTSAQLAEAERLANEAVRADAPIHCFYPDDATLASTDYRSKKELSGPVRLVEIPGSDVCACCGTHLARTGQVGLIKILSVQNYKGGMRLAVACGGRAFQAVSARLEDAAAAGVLLSAAPGALRPAVETLLAAGNTATQNHAALQNCLAVALAAGAVPGKPSVQVVEGVNGDGLRRLCLALVQAANAPCAVLAPGGSGLAYALGAPEGADLDIRPCCRALNEKTGGKGGGKPGFCQGSLPIDAAQNPAQALETARGILADLLADFQ